MNLESSIPENGDRTLGEAGGNVNLLWVENTQKAYIIDIWLSIDHNDPDSLQDGVQFKQAYNERMIAFDRLASEISELVQNFTDVRVDDPEPDDSNLQESESNGEKNERIIRELDREESHGINENFTYKRPYGFVLCGRGFKDVVTWRRIFEQICTMLYEQAPGRFKSLTGSSSFKTRRGNVYFSSDPAHLRVAAEVVPGIFAEINLSANKKYLKELAGV